MGLILTRGREEKGIGRELMRVWWWGVGFSTGKRGSTGGARGRCIVVYRPDKLPLPLYPVYFFLADSGQFLLFSPKLGHKYLKLYTVLAL
jgi:hypothetical protein